MAQVPVIDHCDLCNSDDNVDYFCTNCEEILCDRCRLAHSNSKRTKNDIIVSLSEARKNEITKSPAILCTIHTTEDVTLYCQQCHDFLCIQCLVENHKGHEATSIKEITELRKEESISMMKDLENKKQGYDQTLAAEGKTHLEYITGIDGLKTEISAQRSKIIEVLDEICERQNSELSTLLEKENERYSQACTCIHTNMQAAEKSIQSLKSGIDSGNPVTMTAASKEVKKTLQSLENSELPATSSKPEFTQGIISPSSITEQLGKVHTNTEQKILQLPKTQCDDVDSKSMTSKQQNSLGVTKPKKPGSSSIPDHKNIRLKSTQMTKIKGRSRLIRAIVAVKSKPSLHKRLSGSRNVAWVASDEESFLTLVDTDTGKSIKKSVNLDHIVADAKEYNNDLLIIYNKSQRVDKLSSNGNLVTVFSDMQPHEAWGLCVTKDKDVLVCLISKDSTQGHQIIRLGKTGQILQKIHNTNKGSSLFCTPCRVTSPGSGEIIISDWKGRSVVGTDKDNSRLFTWKGEVAGKLLDAELRPRGIVHDNQNNLFVADFFYHRVYMVKQNRTEATCLLDTSHGLISPWSMAINENGQLLIGCEEGKIFVITYKHALDT